MQKLSQFCQQYGQVPFAVLVLDQQLRVLWSNEQAQVLLPFVTSADGLQPLLEEPLYTVSCRLQKGDPLLLNAVGLPIRLQMYFVPEFEDGIFAGALVQCVPKTDAFAEAEKYRLQRQMQDYLVETAASSFMTIDGVRGAAESDRCVNEALEKLYMQNLRLLRFARNCAVYSELAYSGDLGAMENLDLSQLLSRLCKRISEVLAGKVTLECRIPSAPVLTVGDGGALRRAVTALVRDAAEGASQVTLRLENDDSAAYIFIDGDGSFDSERLSAEVVVCDGDHLGMTTALMILKAHGGSVQANGNGYRMVLPLNTDPALRLEAPMPQYHTDFDDVSVELCDYRQPFADVSENI